MGAPWMVPLDVHSDAGACRGLRRLRADACSRRLTRAAIRLVAVLALLVTSGGVGTAAEEPADAEQAAVAAEGTAVAAEGPPAAAPEGGPSQAADGAPGAVSDEGDAALDEIEEIIVTGRKREEALQDVPLSIQAFDEGQLEQLSITQIDEIGFSVPNLKFDGTNGSNDSARIYIRGVGQDDPRSIKDPGVGIYVDGIYLPRLNGGLLNLVDLERVEVLRGPQGTLYGRNTIGGVISLVTKKPGRELAAESKLKVGTRGLFESRVSVDVPIRLGALEDRVFTRFTFASATDDGYVRNVVDDGHSGDNKLLGARAAIRAFPIDDVTVDLVYEFQRENERNRIAECILTNPFSAARFLSDNWTNFSQDCAATGDKAPWSGFASPLSREDSDIQFLYGIVEWSIDEAKTLRSLSSWRQRETETSSADIEFTPSDFLGTLPGSSKNDAYSQELNFHGLFLEEDLDVSLGLYWDMERGEGTGGGDVLRQFLSAQPGDLLAPNPSGPPLDYTFVDGLLGGALNATIFTLNDRTHVEYENRSYAAYADLTYILFDRLHVQGGLRYTRERKRRFDASEISDVDPTAPPQIGVTQEERFSSWTPSAGLKYEIGENMMVFGRWARGWKSGGFVEPILLGDELMAFQAGGLPTEFDEEIVDTYEIGFKSTWLERRLTFNLTLYWNDYEDIQLSTIGLGEDGTLTVFVNNAGQANTRGGEIESAYLASWDWLPGSNANLLIEAGVGYIHAEFEEFDDTIGCFRVGGPNSPCDPLPALPPGCTSLAFADCSGLGPTLGVVGALLSPDSAQVDKSGLDFKNTPEWNWNVAITYGFDVREWGRLRTRVGWTYQSAVFYNTDNSRNLRQGGFGLLDARISLDTDVWQNATIALWGKNLLDKEYIDGGFSLGATVGTDLRYYGRPRTYGVELIMRFN